MSFTDRTDAGRRLARRLGHLRGSDVVVLALPRGGVPVGSEVAAALDAPLDVLVVRKLGVPFQRELAMGAIGEGVRVLNDQVLRMVHISDEEIAAVEKAERAEAERRSQRFRGSRPRVSLQGKTAVIVDDGIATGATARAACQVARAQGATRIVLAVPVAPPDVAETFADVADEVVCVETPRMLSSIGQWYDDFRQTPDDQVVALLGESAARYDDNDDEITIKAAGVELPGQLTLPAGAAGIVVFAHGSGSGRLSPRNQQVAASLSAVGLGTLLFDLLTPDEAADRANVFDIELLAGRMVAAIRWLGDRQDAPELPLGLFGASTGAAAALWASTEPGVDVAAIVSRGGRPDLAAARLPAVTAPTLLIVGGRDDVVLRLNREAQAALRCESQLSVVPGATHLFEEPGALEEVSGLAGEWFTRHLGGSPE